MESVYTNRLYLLYVIVVEHVCNGLPLEGPGFDSRWEWCKNRASLPSQGTVNGGAVSK